MFIQITCHLCIETNLIFSWNCYWKFGKLYNMSRIVLTRTGLIKFIDRGTNINMILIRLNSQVRDQPSPTPKNKSLCRSICYCTGRFDMLLIGGNSHFTKYRVTESKICFKQNNWIINLIREQGDWFLIWCWNRANRIKHYTRRSKNSKYFFLWFVRSDLSRMWQLMKICSVLFYADR